MKLDARLDSAVFQLTPTRTRCELVITANGKTEKIASGLLHPFLSHLSTAQDQIAKGGYSITLEPDPRTDSSWFTKGTIERFVRFVSTPEVLERVNTIESEILQIDEAIANQRIDNHGLNAVEDHQLRSMESKEGRKPIVDTNGDKAIVLFKPGVPEPESDGSTVQEGNSKVQLLRVLETRRTVLQKEQGMAFARAVAAGFDMDQMAELISFSECFGAKRLREACLKYMELWKQKHETGQWLEIESAEAMSCRSDFPPMNASGIVLSGDIMKQKELAWPESLGELSLSSEGNEKSNDVNTDQRSAIDSQVPVGPHDYFQGNLQHPMYPQWPVHSPSGIPLFPPYPMQGMPYYQNFPGNGPYFQPPYPPAEDPRFDATQKTVQRKQSVDSKGSHTESENGEIGAGKMNLQDVDENMSEEEDEDLRIRVPLKKVGRAVKKQAGMVVIRNINYITKAKHNSPGSEPQSASEPDTDDDSNESDAPKRNHKNHARSSKSKGRGAKHTNARDPDGGDDTIVHGQDTDGGNWKAFQNFLLREEKSDFGDSGMFLAEKEITPNRKQIKTDEDPILHPERDPSAVPDRGISEFDIMSRKPVLLNKPKVYNDESAISHEGFHPHGGSRDIQLDMQFKEMENGGGRYRGMSDDSMVYQQGSMPSKVNSLSDPLAENQGWNAENSKSSNNVTDESFIVPQWSNTQDQVGTDRGTTIDMDSEFLLSLDRTEDSSKRVTGQINYEPDDFSLMPERGTERESVGYDPAVDYEMQFHSEGNIVLESGSQEDAMGVNEGSKKLEKEKKLKEQDALGKRKVETAMRRGKPTKSNPLVEAKERAERLRAFKTDIQKLKKEKEEEQIKRLETLKLERQKRIAARGGSVTPQSSATSQQARSQLPPKLSPGLNKGSKFSESELANSSPTKKLPSAGSSGSQKTTRPSSRLHVSNPSANVLTRSLSSLTDMKEENDSCSSKDPETKAAAIPARRFSDPKGSSSSHQVTLKSGSGNRVVSKLKASDEPETKKMSAVSGPERSRSSILPARGNSDDGKSTGKEAIKKSNGSKSSTNSKSITTKKSNVKTVDQLEDNPVIEKTVVLLEHEMPAIPIIQESESKRKGTSDGNNTEEKTDVIPEYTENHAPPSPITTCEVERDPNDCQLDDQPKAHEVEVDHSPEISKDSDINVSDFYHGDAQNSLMEDPDTGNSKFSKTSSIDSKMVTSIDTGNMHLSVDIDPNVQSEDNKEVEKHHGSSKGFKRFLKFGRKNHNSATNEHDMGLDNLGIDNAAGDDHIATTSSSSEVYLPKNVIPQDDNPIGSTAQKVSRPFSLLSPFRSKNSDKKVVVV